MNPLQTITAIKWLIHLFTVIFFSTLSHCAHSTKLNLRGVQCRGAKVFFNLYYNGRVSMCRKIKCALTTITLSVGCQSLAIYKLVDGMRKEKMRKEEESAHGGKCDNKYACSYEIQSLPFSLLNCPFPV